jgi:DNA-binding NarL/FixJ family response regulator
VPLDGEAAVIGVLLVDDHPLVRAGMRSLIEAGASDIEVVGEAGDGAAAVEAVAAASTPPDVVLMDLSMPGVDGVTATRRLVDDGFAGAVVVLTSFSDRVRVAEALAAGAVGYLLKDSEPAEVLAAIRAAAAGHAPLDPRVARVLLPTAPGRSGDRSDDRGLSERESEVLGLVAEGLANKQIARRLGISERTVKVHLGSVFRRLGVSDRTSAALWARDHGFGS